MNHIYCDLCHLSITVPQKNKELFDEIIKEIKYLRSLTNSHYQLDHLMSEMLQDQSVFYYNNLIERMESENKSIFDFKKKSLKMNSDESFRHQMPTMITLSRCLSDLDVTNINTLYCPQHFGSFLNQFENLKSLTNTLKNELEILTQVIQTSGFIIDKNFLELFNLMKMAQILATHVLEKRQFLIQKIDKLVLKHTLESLRGDYRIETLANTVEQLFSKKINNREDNKINYFKTFQEIKPSVISPTEFISSSSKGAKKEINEALSISDRDHSFYEKCSFLNYEGNIGSYGHLFSCRQGYFWIIKDREKIVSISKSFFLDRSDCSNDFYNEKKY